MSINPNELRLGNIISDIHAAEEFSAIVHKITANRIEYGLSYKSHPNNLKPIKITEEWLLRFGFKEVDSKIGILSSYLKNRVMISVSNSNIYYFKRYHMINGIHQLQNLYFALTGTELILTK